MPVDAPERGVLDHLARLAAGVGPRAEQQCRSPRRRRCGARMPRPRCAERSAHRRRACACSWRASWSGRRRRPWRHLSGEDREESSSTVGLPQHHAKPIAETSQERRGVAGWSCCAIPTAPTLRAAGLACGGACSRRWKQSREGQAMTVDLVRWGVDDLPVLQRANTPEMTRYLGGPETDEALAQQHADYLTCGRPARCGCSASTSTASAAGYAGWWEEVHDGMPVYEVGCSIDPDWQGRGVASTALARDAPPGRGARRSAPDRRLRARRQRRVERAVRAGRVRARGHRGASPPEAATCRGMSVNVWMIDDHPRSEPVSGRR